MKRLLLLLSVLVCVTINCFGQFKNKTYPIYNLKGEFVAYTEIGEHIPDSIPRGVYVVNGYKVPHHLSDDVKKTKSELEKAFVDSIAVIAAINGIVSDGMYIINGKKCIIAHNDSIKIVNGKIVYNK